MYQDTYSKLELVIIIKNCNNLDELEKVTVQIGYLLDRKLLNTYHRTSLMHLVNLKIDEL